MPVSSPCAVAGLGLSWLVLAVALDHRLGQWHGTGAGCPSKACIRAGGIPLGFQGPWAFSYCLLSVALLVA